MFSCLDCLTPRSRPAAYGAAAGRCPSLPFGEDRVQAAQLDRAGAPDHRVHRNLTYENSWLEPEPCERLARVLVVS
jgi:hypothetical protein